MGEVDADVVPAPNGGGAAVNGDDGCCVCDRVAIVTRGAVGLVASASP